MTQVSDLMTRNAISVSSEMLVMDAVELLFKHQLDGLPVIDRNIMVIGTFTQEDLIIKGTGLHLPTLLKILSEFDLYRQDRSGIKRDLKKILSLQVKDVMNREPRLLKSNASMEEAAKTFTEFHHINPIPIVNDMGALMGVLSRYDVIKFYSGETNPKPVSDKPTRPLDDHVNTFIRSFANKFHFVSKFRTQVWFTISLLTALLLIIFGFYISTVSLINITF